MNTDVQTILDAYNQGDFYNQAQTDSKDAATLASAKSYSDTGDAATLSNAKSYVDSGAAVGVETFGNEIYTLSNGASWFSVGGWNRLTALELGNGYRIVQVEFTLKIADYTAAKNKSVISIPLKYAPRYDWHTLQGGTGGTGTNPVRWNMVKDGTMIIESVMDESSVNADFWYPMSTIYITHD